MDLDLRVQRALDRVELVGGSIGDPGDGRMCLMSLVAFLAGEDMRAVSLDEIADYASDSFHAQAA